MSIPTSKILKASKSLVAAASVSHQSPTLEQGQQQHVNIVVNSSSPDLLKEQKVHYGEGEADQEQNPYKNLSARDLASAEQAVEEMSKVITEKDNIIKAFSLIIDLYKNNPLIINKYLIADQSTLKELIQLLTAAESVNIQLADIECTCCSTNYRTIKRIYITSNNEIYSIEMCPAVLQILENYAISITFVTS